MANAAPAGTATAAPVTATPRTVRSAVRLRRADDMACWDMTAPSRMHEASETVRTWQGRRKAPMPGKLGSGCFGHPEAVYRPHRDHSSEPSHPPDSGSGPAPRDRRKGEQGEQADG